MAISYLGPALTALVVAAAIYSLFRILVSADRNMPPTLGSRQSAPSPAGKKDDVS